MWKLWACCLFKFWAFRTLTWCEFSETSLYQVAALEGAQMITLSALSYVITFHSTVWMTGCWNKKNGLSFHGSELAYRRCRFIITFPLYLFIQALNLFKLILQVLLVERYFQRLFGFIFRTFLLTNIVNLCLLDLYIVGVVLCEIPDFHKGIMN